MSRELNVISAKGRELSRNRKKRLRIFIETIVRAGMNAIPLVGGALEKLSFGYIDALSSKQLFDLVCVIEEELRKMKSTEQSLSEGDITKITNSILESPNIAQLADAIDAASIHTTAVLGDILLQIAQQRVIEVQSSRRAMQEYANLYRKQEDIHLTIQSSAAREDALLTRIFHKKEGKTS